MLKCANPNCGKEFQESKHQKGRQKFCSKKCCNDFYKEYRSNWQINNKDKTKKARRKYHQKNKLKVLTYYSRDNIVPKCVCCGETIIEFLGIDHINNNGAEERKQIGLIGADFYAWLIKQGYPEGYQVMCHNCNQGRQINNGICPHKQKELKDESDAETTC